MSKFTKQAIRTACLELLEERPFDKITVKDIVMRCELNRNTFYYYYKDIYDVLEDIFLVEQQKLHGRNWEDATVYEAYLAVSDILLRHRTAILHLYSSKHQDILLNYLRSAIIDFVRPFVERRVRGRKLTKEDVDYIVSFYSCALGAYTRQWIMEGMKEDKQHILRRLPDTFEMTIDTLIRQCEENTYENK